LVPSEGKLILAVVQESSAAAVDSLAADIPAIAASLAAKHKPSPDQQLPLDESAVARTFALLRSSASAKSAMDALAPPEAQPFVHAAMKLEGAQVLELVRDLPEIQKVMEAVKKGGKPPAAAVSILLAHVKAFPPAVLDELPEKVQSAVEVLGGLDAEGVESFLAMQGDHSDLTPEQQKAAAKRAAKSVLVSEGKRQVAWVRSNPCGFRVLLFLGGLALACSAAFHILVETFNEFNVLKMAMNSYLVLLGLLITVMEAESKFCQLQVVGKLRAHAEFLFKPNGTCLSHFNHTRESPLNLPLSVCRQAVLLRIRRRPLHLPDRPADGRGG
jgi:hypothetical protein